eukprot:2217493-Prorocentrum_lima.AAC.1
MSPIFGPDIPELMTPAAVPDGFAFPESARAAALRHMLLECQQHMYGVGLSSAASLDARLHTTI